MANTPNPDDSSRRTLRFSLFLQGFALVMMGGALIVRVTVLGWDMAAFLLTGLVVVIAGAMGWTVNRLRND
ncbi:MAG: hypothetical protein WAO50_05300 [Candidatus Nanopelagicales bacterium]|jgi:hypothetical protein|nr:hypothetical protein [Candidatus Nanopelagicales bacterium]MCF8536844.1 hypothetical protein [Candidatus Nanopelagicales bacterium]MCF8541675.1 hypothetical protein [Candidatus Nanopelagicales bacterium]MCF8556141.1 hypothetical protein [Candidatus Nanopelagicales bacterium]